MRWLTRIFGPSRAGDAAQAHITFGSTSIGRTMSRTGLLLKKQLWIWPIVAIVLLAAIGYFIRVSIQRTMEDNLGEQLETLLTVERAMLENWLAVQESSAQTLANDRQVRQIIEQLHASAPGEAAPDPTATNKLHVQLAQELGPGLSSHKFVGYLVADKQMQILAASNPELIGQRVPEYEAMLTRALDGEPTVSPPFASVAIVKDDQGRSRAGAPTMFALAPVRDDRLQVIAVLGVRIRPEQEFTRIMQLGRLGETGETYAIDKHGLLVSNSRYDESLIMLGLLPDKPDAVSILNIEARDPGVNMVRGYRPQVRRSELPLTKIAAAAVAGTTGIDIKGHRDYRGVPSVGAWTWLPKYEIGILTKVEMAEAFAPLTILKRAFFSMFALLALGAVAIFVFTIVVARMQREAQKAAIEAKQLGQYRLEERIGAGAMGVVYKGHHAMLRRPTAIKMLDIARVNEASIARFEREVQITCKLNNPNTVAIYDYGRTPEGVFYYAMEYLDGIDLQALVEKYGPQPEGRVIAILRQVCGSLFEAHSLGLVHRDIKPANIMLNRRGGLPDVAKVLDFGLVKAVGDDARGQGGGEMSGTPLYMSPEAIQTPDSVDARSDLYAVGAVGYFLLTGRPVFDVRTLAELCQHHIESSPEALSQKRGSAVSPELEHAILACLEKSRAKRPQTARDFAALLDRVVTAAWTLDDAEAWWSRHDRNQPGVSGAAAASAPATGSGSGVSGTTHAAALDRTIIHDGPPPPT